ncbi:hypothetical protein [Bremerella alba]|uniref:Uncharacterized protein n=1 Tax=Bremerella alba TaxID=980252 RepID=A0A7V8V4A6_9BACT|nr:hypothetical protein [Bremerella alba]MBA2114601.1 hypothetical protein [Bremerella alba]
MKWQHAAGMMSVFGLTMVGLVVGSGCQPPPQEVPDQPASTTPDDNELENPSSAIDTDPNMDPRNTQGS